MMYFLQLQEKSLEVNTDENSIGINEQDRKSTRLNSSHRSQSRMPSSA